MDPRQRVELLPDPVWTNRYKGDERVRNQLLFREYLLENPEARRRYEQAKRAAANQHQDQPRQYVGAKTDVVGSLLADARETRYTDRLPSFVS
jgi:GrpB-like predicted nucleotidyltransferase (UPF0157 family)